jgi:pimeloyl-ACP methyl ester carboxylesterase
MTKNIFIAFLALGFPLFVSAQSLPSRPTEAAHPGSSDYTYSFNKESIQIDGRMVDVFLPVGASGELFSVVVFGHGQAIGLESYLLTFEHLARKGVAVIYPTYDNGFFDRDWRRMAKDFNSLATQAMARYSSRLNPQQIVYAGHSKGAYIALMAAGAPLVGNQVRPSSLVLFAPAGVDAEYLRQMNPEIPLNLIWGERDDVITRASVWDIYAKAPSRYKQFIDVKSYSGLAADHYFVMTKAAMFGGRDGISPFHYFGSWKWMIGAAQDLQSENRMTNPYVYGDMTSTTGIAGVSHGVTRNW